MGLGGGDHSRQEPFVPGVLSPWCWARGCGRRAPGAVLHPEVLSAGMGSPRTRSQPWSWGIPVPTLSETWFGFRVRSQELDLGILRGLFCSGKLPVTALSGLQGSGGGLGASPGLPQGYLGSLGPGAGVWLRLQLEKPSSIFWDTPTAPARGEPQVPAGLLTEKRLLF